ncbi:MAG: NAD-dependent epimerase/dehydratase family protein, partial [Cyclobacteriaceae bacterium]
MTTERKALIIGATGLIGRELTKLLSQTDYYQKIYVLVRRETGLSGERIEEIMANFDDLEESLNSIQADDVYNCLGTTMKKAGSKEEFHKVDFGYPIEIARIMKKKGSEAFLNVSALGAN